MEQLNDEAKEELVQKLETLRAAVSVSAVDLDLESQEATSPLPHLDDPLRAKSQLKEQPFTSDVPIVGSLIARLRQTWNNVSTIWYVRPLVQQQNEFNYLVVQQLEEIETITGEVETMAADSDRESVTVARQVAELNSLLIRLDRRLEAIEAHLIELESRQ